MSDPRPNELGGQVQPNTLSSQAGRAPTTLPVSGAPGWARPVQAPVGLGTQGPSQAPAASPRTYGRTARARGFGLWAVIVAMIIAIQFVRGFAGGAGATATTAPRSSTAGITVLAADVTAGTVVFGSDITPACDITGAGTQFSLKTPVWWYAHLNVMQASSDTVVTILKRDGVPVDRGMGPDSAEGDWDGLCAGRSFRYYGPGSFRFEVWTADEKLLLASGEFQVTVN